MKSRVWGTSSKIILTGKTGVAGKNQCQCHYISVHHNPTRTGLGSNLASLVTVRLLSNLKISAWPHVADWYSINKKYKKRNCPCALHAGTQETEVQFHLFLTSTLESMSGQLHTPAARIPDLSARYPGHGPEVTLKFFLIVIPFLINKESVSKKQ